MTGAARKEFAHLSSQQLRKVHEQIEGDYWEPYSPKMCAAARRYGLKPDELSSALRAWEFAKDARGYVGPLCVP